MAKEDLTSEQKIFRDSIGQKATVDRDTVDSTTSQHFTERLIDLGMAYQKEPQHRLQHFRYRGSAAVHIYTNELLGLINFAPQVRPLLLHRCPEDLASKAFDDLLRSLKLAYDRSHGKLRSGF